MTDLAPLVWSQTYLDLAEQYGNIPEFAGVEFHQLDGNDPRRIASAILAAEWWRDLHSAALLDLPLPEEEPLRLIRQKQASLAVAAATDWVEVATRWRRARSLPRTPQQWISFYEANAQARQGVAS